MNKKPVVIITGAANGIGRATALQFAMEGYALELLDISSDGFPALKDELAAMGADFSFITADLYETDRLQTIVKDVISRRGKVDVLVNNAAWRTIETMRTIEVDTWEKTLKINLTAPAFLAKYVAAEMERAGRPGVVINIGSVMSQRTAGYSPAYVTCKGALESLTYELAALYGPKGIRVLTVSPGNIETNLSQDYRDDGGRDVSDELVDHMNGETPLKRSGKPAEIARIIAWLSSDGASFITGVNIVADGGFCHNFNSYKMKRLQFPKEF